jgi:hypothetical protein
VTIIEYQRNVMEQKQTSCKIEQTHLPFATTMGRHHDGGFVVIGTRFY